MHETTYEKFKYLNQLCCSFKIVTEDITSLFEECQCLIKKRVNTLYITVAEYKEE